MMIARTFLPLSLLATRAVAQNAGSIAVMGSTLVSAMMMLVGNEDKIYIMDKVEGNPTPINGHPAWAAEWDIPSGKATPMDMSTNVFCASGMHLPNGSYATFGGNNAVGPGGNTSAAQPDVTYGDFDGGLTIRILSPCRSTGACQWYDNTTFLAMQRRRWYSAAEALADGTVVLIGGFVDGGYINRNFPDTQPGYEGGAAESTYEFFPANGRTPVVMSFLNETSGLNAYAHTFLMASGKMFVQANVSTVLWDYNNNIETPLPPMPNNVARVYPASGAVAMLPLTPANNYTPTVLFCGGNAMPSDNYGNYANPAVNTWEWPASNDCQRITPEPTDGSQPVYVQDDDMIVGRTMGQFIILPDGKLLVVNGGLNGTAGYATQTGQTPLFGDMPFGMSLASGPVLQPAIYDPNAPAGSRWSNTGLSSSSIPRLYHSSAILMPDASVMIAGSNPNVDYNASTTFPTEYRAEKFYPPYFSAGTRPSPSGIPSSLSYGGDPFDLSLDSSSYSGDANDAAGNTTVVLIRPGFTTHAMNMGQRFLQLNNTFTVSDNGTITLHVAQAPPNANILQPGPVFMFVVVHGIPSNGTLVIVGSGNVGTQQILPVSALPQSVLSQTPVKGNGSNSTAGEHSSTGTSSGVSKGVVIGGILGAIAVLAVVGIILTVCLKKRSNANSRKGFNAPDAPMGGYPLGAAPERFSGSTVTDSAAFIPLKQYNESSTWNPSHPSAMASSASFDGDHGGSTPLSGYRDYDPYADMRGAQGGRHMSPTGPGTPEPGGYQYQRSSGYAR